MKQVLIRQARPLPTKMRTVVCAGLIAAGSWMTPSAIADNAIKTVDPVQFAQTPLTLSNGIQGTVVNVPSRDPVDYGPLLKGELGKEVTLTAQLFMPKNARGPIPAVIVTPGSGNIGPHHIAHAATLTSAGIAALVLDPFTARKVTSTVADQSLVSWAASTYDVFAAIKVLRAQAGIDGARIGATGGSRGGTAVMMAASAPLSNAILGPGKGLSAVVAGYPWCGAQFHSAKLADKASLLVLQGDKDDWVSVQQCQDATHAMKIAGQNVSMKLFPGALHSFDREGVPRTPIPEAVTSTIYPTVYMDDAGHYYNMRTGKVDPALTKAVFDTYAVKGGFLRKGVTIGSDGTQAAEFSQEMLDFFKDRLQQP
ncbi:hypothetical protein D3870_06005 [Noviherbaspirillum cavernae]|uniref:Dienelactone hydrolase domain-containing protein n=1 Tax=Noviherbaspirillum cavernae TaxID=2320862 RepID=A0A418WZL3_9BURK|nr:prolyl oligopeptidase family serine peptidase [Noviherbaspirillum cavernae]RJG05631.1 hypothetical protein D3870_06005 [Noviherbaspirillum cavernae]